MICFKFREHKVDIYIHWKLNPISGKVWNDVIRRDRVNLTRKFFRLHKYPKQPQSDHNLFPVVYFDICLAIGIKITLKWRLSLMKLAIVWKYSKLIFFKPKHMKTSNLWHKRVIYLKKAENMQNKYLVRKSENLCKKRFFFNFFNFLNMLKDPRNSKYSIFYASQVIPIDRLVIPNSLLFSSYESSSTLEASKNVSHSH